MLHHRSINTYSSLKHSTFFSSFVFFAGRIHPSLFTRKSTNHCQRVNSLDASFQECSPFCSLKSNIFFFPFSCTLKDHFFSAKYPFENTSKLIHFTPSHQTLAAYATKCHEDALFNRWKKAVATVHLCLSPSSRCLLQSSSWPSIQRKCIWLFFFTDLVLGDVYNQPCNEVNFENQA